MYCCNDCGTFMEPYEQNEQGEDLCEYCGSTDIEKAGSCGVCKEPIRSCDDYCADCMEKAAGKIGELEALFEIDRAAAKDLLLTVMERED